MHASNVRAQKSAPRTRKVSVAATAADSGTGAAGQQTKVALAAYFIAEKRGFEPGHELDDWLAAEAEIARLEQPRAAQGVEVVQAGNMS